MRTTSTKILYSLCQSFDSRKAKIMRWYTLSFHYPICINSRTETMSESQIKIVLLSFTGSIVAYRRRKHEIKLFWNKSLLDSIVDWMCHTKNEADLCIESTHSKVKSAQIIILVMMMSVPWTLCLVDEYNSNQWMNTVYIWIILSSHYELLREWLSDFERTFLQL